MTGISAICKTALSAMHRRIDDSLPGRVGPAETVMAAILVVFAFILLPAGPGAGAAENSSSGDDPGVYTIYPSESGTSTDRPEPGYFDGLVMDIFDRAGISYRVAEQLPWKRVTELALNGRHSVIYPTTRTRAREDAFKWVGPISRTIWNLYGFVGDHWQGKPFDDILENARIGVLMGSAREPYLRARGASQLIGVPREELLLPMLAADRLDLVAIGGNVLRHYLDGNPDLNLQGKITGALAYRQCYLYVAISPDVPDADIDRLQQSLDAMKQDGGFVAHRAAHGLSANPESGFIRDMVNLDNNGRDCVDLFGRADD